tara:strand:- start:583 stop:1245 length:663 start_codon:yes stop_codon:yes gene_type:complete
MILSESHKRFITAMLLGTGFWIIFFYAHILMFSVVLIGILITILAKEWTVLFKHNKILYWILMPFYPVLPFIILLYFNHDIHYRILLYYLFLLVFSFDTGAYIVGTLIGRHKIIPFVSPHKTIEGCIGGFFSAIIVFYFALWEDGLHMSYNTAIPFVLIVCMIAFFGDMFESLLKRQARLKDSGNSLPGHGGFLDRFDAVMMVSFFFFLFRNQLINLFIT